MKHLYFMRHGLSVMNKQGIFSSSSDTPLAEEGVLQCHEAAKFFKGIKVDAIVSSPLKRAYDSARIVAEDIGFPVDKIIISDYLVERDFGPLEGTRYTRSHNLDQIDGVEHSTSVIVRAEEALKVINQLDADTVFVVGHGTIGRALRHITNPDLDYYKTTSFNNAEVVKLI